MLYTLTSADEDIPVPGGSSAVELRALYAPGGENQEGEPAS